MKSRAVNTTKKQDEYRAAILGKPVKRRYVRQDQLIPKLTPVEDKLKYIDNCFYWIGEYKNGRETKEKLLRTLSALEQHCNELKKLLS